MPITRSTTEKRATQSEQFKQVSNGLISMDHVDVAYSGSRLDSKSKSSRSSRKAKAALQLAQLKQKQVELDNEMRLAAVKNEVEMARLQMTLAEESGSDGGDSAPEEEDKTLELRKYLEDCRIHSAKDKKEPKVVQPRPAAVRIDLPKVELQPFDGDPANYWMFIRQFDACIHDNVHDLGQRLLYLIYYCKGKAKEAIKGCVMLDSEAGYPRAREILRERFGQAHKIARALIDGVLQGFRSQIDTPEDFDELATRMQNCEIALTQMGYTSDMNALPTLEKIVRRFSLNVQEHWALRADNIMQLGKDPRLEDLTAFVVERARVYGSRFGQLVRENEQRQIKPVRQYTNARPTTSHNFSINKVRQEPLVDCPLCHELHGLEVCERFACLNIAERWETLKKLGRCFKCMEDTHHAAGCKSREVCGTDGCKGRHHKLLHDNKKVRVESRNCCATSGVSGLVHLGMLPVRVRGPCGEIDALAFLDNGSDTTLVRSDIVERLGIKCKNSELTIQTVNGTSSHRSKRCKLEVMSSDGTTVLTIDEAHAVQDLPIRSTAWRRKDIATRWPYLRDVPFADKQNGKVELLIGCDVPEAHWVLEQRRGGRRQPFATKTPLGWLIHGPVTPIGPQINYMVNKKDAVQIDWQRLYDQEFMDIGTSQIGLSIEEMQAVRIVEDAAKLVNGRYEVPLPWRPTHAALPDSRGLAISRLEQLKRKLNRDSKLFDCYREQIKQLEQKGYAERLNETEMQAGTRSCWYIPHHAVTHPKKPDKVRIVFDCAAKCGGISLNDCLYPGPDNISNLCSILMGFRQNLIAVAADIEEMFLRVKLAEKDRDMLRFLWWADGKIWNDPVVYKLNVHPFGATSSPFCANYALRKAVESMNEDCMYNKRDVAATCFYVDDFITSFENKDIATDFSLRLTGNLQKGGFKLRKWLSNSDEVLMKVAEVECRERSLSLSDRKTACQRALGINWNTETDLLQFEFKPKIGVLSRRSILSCVSSLFDPLGLISPLLLPAKILLQTLCKKGLGWDEPIPEKEEREWRLWTDSMLGVNDLTLDRCIKQGCGRNMKESPQLHIFCDASEKGYGTVAYGRYHTEVGIKCSLIWGKARVAPTKTVSIPRLELSAAVLGIRSWQCISKSLPDEFQDVYFWTDSTIVLYYIHNETDRFNTFVANRLSIIHECSNPSQWKYVNTEDNPADKASRGCYVKDESLKLWINGPEFLKSSIENWPTQPQGLQQPDGVERKVTKVYAMTSNEEDECTYLLNYFSVWFKLVKAVAWWLRYKDYLLIMSGVKKNSRLMTGALKLTEITNASVSIIELVQKQCMRE